MTELEEVLDCLLDLYAQDCFKPKTNKFEHVFISAQEHAEEILLKHGKLKEIPGFGIVREDWTPENHIEYIKENVEREMYFLKQRHAEEKE